MDVGGYIEHDGDDDRIRDDGMRGEIFVGCGREVGCSRGNGESVGAVECNRDDGRMHDIKKSDVSIECSREISCSHDNEESVEAIKCDGDDSCIRDNEMK